MKTTLTQEQKEILCGTLLGDSSLKCQGKGTRTPMFNCEHGPLQEDYAALIAEKLDGKVTTRYRFDKRTEKTYTSHTITTVANTEYIPLYKNLYINGKKRITKEFLKNFTARSLAFLYMDDGYQIHDTMFICTDSFDEESCDNLIEHCSSNFNLHFRKNKRSNGKIRLRLRFSDRQKFIEIVSPYMLDSLKYKFPSNIIYHKCKNNIKPTTEEFVQRLSKMYGDIFDYSKVEYKNNHTPVCLLRKWDENSELWRMPLVLLRKKNKKF